MAWSRGLVVGGRVEVLGGVDGVHVRDDHHEVLDEAGLVAARDEGVVGRGRRAHRRPCG